MAYRLIPTSRSEQYGLSSSAFEIVGEALNQALQEDPGISSIIPEVRVIIGMRHRIAHGYDDIKDEVVWDVATVAVLALQVQLNNLLQERG